MQVESRIDCDLAQVPTIAKRAEALGFDALNTHETQHDPFFPLVLAAEHTETITLGTNVAIAFPRSPMITANLGWDLQGLSDGRFRLGLGPQVKGHNERRFSVPWSPPAPRLREYILALRAIWDCWTSGGPLDFQGDHYTFTLMTPFFRPEPISHPHIPVYIAAVGPVMCRIAGEVCDGLRLHPLLSTKYLNDIVLPNIEAGARAAGRSITDVDLICGGFVIPADDDNSIRAGKAAIAQRIAFYSSTRTYQGVLDVHGWGHMTAQFHEMAAQDRWAEMPEIVSDEMLEAFASIGPPEDAARDVLARYGPTCSAVALDMPPGTDTDDATCRRLIDTLHAG